MTTAYDVPPQKLLESVSEKLKKMKALAPPDYLTYVKSGAGRERQPYDDDWWYLRCASLLRKLYIHGPLGVNRLSRLFGNKKNRGMKPEKRRRGSRSIIQDALVRLERVELVERAKNGRKLTSKGVSLLDKTAHEIKKTIQELERY